MFNNLRELISTMPDDKVCREYLVKQRWPDGKVICPFCGHGKCYVIEGGKKFKCASSQCYKKFSATVGTIFEASNIPLNKWFTAIYLVSAHKKGISSYQLAKDIGVSQKASWFMLHRIREMMRPKENIKLDNIVEADEVYIGGKVGNMSKTKRTQLRQEGRTYDTKTMVMGMIERGGNLKLVTIGKSNNIMALQSTINDNVDKDAVVITDSFGGYTGIDKTFAGHEVVNHSEDEYVRDSVIHTNTIEGAFSHFKRSIYGIYHFCTAKHLSRYCDETMFRYNLRKMNDAARFNFSLSQVEGRLTYKDLVKKPEITPTQSELNKAAYIKGKQRRKRIAQLKNGEIIAEYDTIVEAAATLNISKTNIRLVLIGENKSCGGYEWKYL
jgi:transposase-like protein